jgi:serine/threonine protein kinase
MSPEQVIGERDVDGRSNVYSLGCVLCEIPRGSLPFEAASAQAMLAKRFVETPMPVSVARPEASASIAVILLEGRVRRAASALRVTASKSEHIPQREIRRSEGTPHRSPTEPRRAT